MKWRETVEYRRKYIYKILWVNYCFPSAPFYLRSNLQNIFITALFNTKDVKAVGNDKTFFKLNN